MRRIFNIAYYETLIIFKDRILLMLLFAVPLLYATVFGFVYSAGILNNVPLAIVDLDHSKSSREITTAFENSPRFQRVPGIDSQAELEKAMQEGIVRAGIVIPERFEFKQQMRQPVQILGAYDASNLIWGYNTRRYLREVITDFNDRHTSEFLAGMGMSPSQVSSVMNTVNCNYEVWYNPTFSYSTYFYPGLLLMVIHQICLLSISLTVTREKERNTWLQYLGSCLPSWQIFMGKALPYFIVNFFNYALLLWVAAQFVGAKIEGSIWLIILLGLLFDVIITALGFLISVLAPNSLQVTRYLMLLSVPIFLTSGFSWPETHIPMAVNALANLMPYTWMSEAFRMVTVKNLPLAYVLNHLLVLGAMALVALLLAATFKKHRRPPNHHGVIVNSGTSYPGN